MPIEIRIERVEEFLPQALDGIYIYNFSCFPVAVAGS